MSVDRNYDVAGNVDGSDSDQESANAGGNCVVIEDATDSDTSSTKSRWEKSQLQNGDLLYLTQDSAATSRSSSATMGKPSTGDKTNNNFTQEQGQNNNQASNKSGEASVDHRQFLCGDRANTALPEAGTEKQQEEGSHGLKRASSSGDPTNESETRARPRLNNFIPPLIEACDKVLEFGPHRGRSYASVATNETKWCHELEEENNPNKQQQDFIGYLNAISKLCPSEEEFPLLPYEQRMLIARERTFTKEITDFLDDSDGDGDYCPAPKLVECEGCGDIHPESDPNTFSDYLNASRQILFYNREWKEWGGMLEGLDEGPGKGCHWEEHSQGE